MIEALSKITGVINDASLEAYVALTSRIQINEAPVCPEGTFEWERRPGQVLCISSEEVTVAGALFGALLLGCALVPRGTKSQNPEL